MPLTSSAEESSTPRQHDLLLLHPAPLSPQSLTPIPGQAGFFIGESTESDERSGSGNTEDDAAITEATTASQSHNDANVPRVDSNVSLSSLSSDSLSHTEENIFIHEYLPEVLSQDHPPKDSCHDTCPECPQLSEKFSAIQLSSPGGETSNGTANFAQPVTKTKRSSSIKKKRSIRKPRNIDTPKTSDASQKDCKKTESQNADRDKKSNLVRRTSSRKKADDKSSNGKEGTKAGLIRRSSMKRRSSLGLNTMEDSMFSFQRRDLLRSTGDQETQAKSKYKVVLLGDAGVGKTSFITRIQQDVGTCGEGDTPRVLSEPRIVTRSTLQLEFWDTAGGTEYDHIRRFTFLKTDIFLVCYSLPDTTSLDNAETKWIPTAEEHVQKSHIILVALKTDQVEDKSTVETRAESIAENLGVGHVTTSSVELFLDTLYQIVNNYQEQRSTM